MSAPTKRDKIRRLLELAFGWVPSPRSRPLDSTGGFVSGSDERGRPLRTETCPDCLANDRVPTPGCESCGGRGWLPLEGPDPMENKGAIAIGGLEQVRKYDRQRQQERELDRLARFLADPETEGAGDVWTYAIEHFESLVHSSSLLELLRALDRLQRERPWLYDALWLAFERPFDEHVLPMRASLERAVDEAIALLEHWLPDEVRVPQWALVGQPSQMGGKGRWANEAQQRRRNAEITALAAQGLGPCEIARRVGLDHSQVSRILALYRDCA